MEGLKGETGREESKEGGEMEDRTAREGGKEENNKRVDGMAKKVGRKTNMEVKIRKTTGQNHIKRVHKFFFLFLEGKIRKITGQKHILTITHFFQFLSATLAILHP